MRYRLLTMLHDFDGLLAIGLYRRHRLRYRRRGLHCVLSELAHLVCHHRKTAAVFARTRCFNGGVQREQIGLFVVFLVVVVVLLVFFRFVFVVLFCCHSALLDVGVVLDGIHGLSDLEHPVGRCLLRGLRHLLHGGRVTLHLHHRHAHYHGSGSQRQRKI